MCLLKTAVVCAVLLYTSVSSAQIQLMPKEKERALRGSIPQIENAELAKKISEATLYTEKEMPLAYQFQELSGGVGVRNTVFYSPYVQVNGSPLPTNGNREFPWRTPGGLDGAEKETDEFRFIWLPRKDDGTVWPVVVYRAPLEKSDSVNMPIPMGWRWIYPEGTIFGEVLCMNFSDGYKYTFEMRLRIREKNDWEVEIYRPYQSFDDLKSKVAQIDKSVSVQPVALAKKVLQDTRHPRRAFKETAGELVLPSFPPHVVKTLLTAVPFKPVMGTVFHSQGDISVFAPTAKNVENIVPPQYTATFLGLDKESCANCHKHTLKHVDRFQNREWYGYVRGSDGIFSFHPIDPSSVGFGNGVRLRKSMVDAKMVEMYDESKHPTSKYLRTKDFENRPAASYPRTGQFTLGG